MAYESRLKRKSIQYTAILPGKVRPADHHLGIRSRNRKHLYIFFEEVKKKMISVFVPNMESDFI